METTRGMPSGTTLSPMPPAGTGSTTAGHADTVVAETTDGSETTDSGDASSGELPAGPPQWPAYEDVGEAVGMTAIHTALLGHHAIGQAWGDYDNDGWLDLYVTGGLASSVLFHNEGDGTFTESPLSPQVELFEAATAGAAWADYDNDGWLDLYVTCDGRNYLFHNDAGVALVDVTEEARVLDDRYGVMVAWGDYDADGWLDLYAANHGGDRDAIYHNDGNGTFTEVSELIGAEQNNKAAFAMTFIDYDKDGDPDLHIVNDHIHGNDLFRNDGPGCGGWCFTDVREESGAGIYINGMGQAVGDYDNDGDLDLFFSDIFHTHLMQSHTEQGSPTFSEVTLHSGLEFAAISWGTVFIDFDNDGWLDLYLASQNNVPHLANRLFRNRRNGSFEDVTEHLGDINTAFTYGVGYADYDHDGFIDLVVGNRGTDYQLLHNTATTGPGHHWITLALHGSEPINNDAIGAWVTVTDTLGIERVAEVRSGSTMGGGNSMRLHFGFGDASLSTVHVRWPDGTESDYADLPTDAIIDLDYPAP